jgi:hypothetical protein
MERSTTAFRDTAALVASFAAPAMGVVYWLCRLEFSNNPPGPVLLAVGIAWLLINLPVAWRSAWGRRASAPSWLMSDATACLAGLAIVLILGGTFGRIAGPPVALTGFLLLMARCRRQVGEGGLRRGIRTLGCGAVLGAFLACWAWGDRYHDPLLRWSILGGRAHRDQLFHASLANMIRTYGVPSTGLDGVPFVPYHYGSHFLFAQLGELIGIPGMDVYELVYPVVFLPLLIHAVLIAAVASSGVGSALQSSRRVLFWFALIVGLVGVVPSSERQIGVWFDSDLFSESMCLAATVLLLGLAVGAGISLGRGEGPVGLRVSELALAVAGFPAFVAALGFLKVSVAAVLLGAGTLICVSWRPLRRNRAVAIGLALGFVVLASISRLVSPALATPVVPLAFIRNWVSAGWRGYYPLLELQVLLAAVALRLWQERCGTVADLVAAWRRGALLDIGFAGFAALVGFLPGMILDLASAAHYFATVQHWIALPILLGAIISGRGEAVAEPHSGWRWTQVPLWKLGAIVLLLPGAATILIDTLSHARLMVRMNLWARGLPPPFVPAPENVSLPRAKIVRSLRKGQLGLAVGLMREQTDRQQARRDPRARTIELLSGLYNLPAGEKRVTLLHIPKSNRAYWDLLAPVGGGTVVAPEPPWATPFVAPALSGLAMLGGLPAPADIPQGGIYGYASYALQVGRPGSTAASPEALLGRAAEMGFRRVLVLDIGADGAPRLEERCSPGTRRILE